MAGGGTAGHTSPLLATADALRRIDAGVEVVALGTPRGLEVRVVPEAGYPLELVPPVPLPRSLSADAAPRWSCGRKMPCRGWQTSSALASPGTPRPASGRAGSGTATPPACR